MFSGEIFGYAYYHQQSFISKKINKIYEVRCYLQILVWLEQRDPFLVQQMRPAFSLSDARESVVPGIVNTFVHTEPLMYFLLKEKTHCFDF